MSKIVQAANSMIVSKDRVTDVHVAQESPSEYFFIFDKKYLWSITTGGSDGDDLMLFYYPKLSDSESAASRLTYHWEPEEFIRFSASEIGTKEAKQTFSELYSIVKGKQFGVDQVLDEIININF